MDFKLENINAILKACKGNKIIKDGFKLKNIEVSTRKASDSNNDDTTIIVNRVSEIPFKFRYKNDSNMWISYQINYFLDKQVFIKSDKFQAEIEIEYYLNGQFHRKVYETELLSKRYWNIRIKDGYLF